MKETACIYALVDPRDNRMRYIGQTVQDLEVRLNYHWYRPTSILTEEWFCELDKHGLKPKLKALEYVPVSISKKAEQRYIRRMTNNGINLLNVIKTAAYKPPVVPLDKVEKRHVTLQISHKSYDTLSEISTRQGKVMSHWLDEHLEEIAKYLSEAKKEETK